MNNTLCGKMIQKSGMPEPRPCIQKKKHHGNHTPDLTGLKNVFGYIEVLKRGATSKSRETHWWVLDKFGKINLIPANGLFSGRWTGSRVAKGSGLGSVDKKGRLRPEYTTVSRHRRFIFNKNHPEYKNYKGMPFFEGWDPDKGGSFWSGYRWIIENIGRKPKGSTLHVIDHEKGFVPGNLEWATPKVQSNQRMFLIISRQKHRIKELETEIEKLKPVSDMRLY